MFFLESEKLQQVKFDELIKVQKKVKDKAVNLALNSVTKTFEGFREEDLRKRDKLAFQVKEFRKDLRRLYVELENKNDSVHVNKLNHLSSVYIFVFKQCFMLYF